MDDEYNMIESVHSKPALLHLFLFEIPTQFSSIHYNPCQFISVLRTVSE